MFIHIKEKNIEISFSSDQICISTKLLCVKKESNPHRFIRFMRVRSRLYPNINIITN